MKKLFLFSIAFLLVIPTLVLADGALIPPANFYTRETEQNAAIFYEEETKTETMVISVEFEGNAKDFAWIIPTPTKPEVEKGSLNLFRSLAQLTTGTVSYDISLGSALPKGAEEGAVEVIEETSIDYYDVAVLSATDKKALVNWLNENGYQYPEKYVYILNEYINNQWYFTALKINTEVAELETIGQELKRGEATPVQFTFQTENIVYPLRISRIGMEEKRSVGIILYIFADHKKDLTDFSTPYADKIKRDEIEKLAADSQGNPWVKPAERKYFLTKLYSSVSYLKMNEDLFPQDAKDNKKVKGGRSWDLEKIAKMILSLILALGVVTVIILFSPFGLCFIICSLVQFFSKSRRAHCVAWVFQIVDFVLYLILLFAAVLTEVIDWQEGIGVILNPSRYSGEGVVYLAALVASLLFVVGMLEVMFWQRRYHKRSKIKK